MPPLTKTNAMRLLDQANISYKIKSYPVNDTYFSGIYSAEKFEMSPDEVFKTLVTKGDKNGINVFCIPVSQELDLKKAATISKNKKIEMISVKDMLPITGYVRGACSPIGMKKAFPTFLDETAILFDEIGISAGAKGTEIIINAELLCEFIGATFHDLT